MSGFPLPPPEPDALAISAALTARIHTEIAAAGGWIGFERYMQCALYEPGLGYYSAGSAKLGPAGDFTTAPELGDALARALAIELEPALATLHDPVLLELGAGSGSLAQQLLAELSRRGAPPVPYRILEPSADLEQRQREVLAPWGERVSWLERLPERPFEGLIIANEVLDALPVACFVKRRERALPLGVAVGEGAFVWAEGPEDRELGRAVERIETALGFALPEGYRSEVCLMLPGWLASLGGALKRGGVWLVDYGYARRDYYHSQRAGGTLICHYRHRSFDDPFFLPGLVDISAWADFSAAAEAALAGGLEVTGYTTQAQFLLEALGAGLVNADAGPEALSALKTLVLPGEMGERFKLLRLGKGLALSPLPGRDFRGLL
ncbi:MAG TPA: SAM-dependent methyltransferase [Gammaproteobacteria bacterium]|nr:SAM-dependent methyltransferase [Gammaproteobacteria bacterium]